MYLTADKFFTTLSQKQSRASVTSKSIQYNKTNSNKGVKMDISKEDFVRLTTEGYPITLRHDVDEFYEMFSAFVNQSHDNNFFAELDEGVVLHAGMRTEVCKMLYEKGNVTILSKITDKNTSSSTGEFELQEEFQILGHACLGVLYFCDLYATATGQSTQLDTGSKKTDIAENKKYNIWPM